MLLIPILKVRHGIALAAIVLGLAATGAQAAEVKKSPSPFQGFSSDNGKPVDVTSEALEVHQEEQMALFTGNVVATQGESTLCSPKLTVYYDNAGGQQPADVAAQSGAIKKLEASGGVIVTAKDQVATGKTGVFDMGTNTATLTEDVVLTQGKSVIKGDRLIADLKTGVVRVEGSKGVSSIFQKTAQAGAPTALSCSSLTKGSTP